MEHRLTYICGALLPGVAILLLAAHALRQGAVDFALVMAGLGGLLTVSRQGWVRWVGVAALMWGGYMWADVTVDFLRFRLAMELPWTRLAWIMGGIMVLNVSAVMGLLGNPGRKRFVRDEREGRAVGAAVVITVVLLSIVRSKVSFPILLGDRFFPGWGWIEIGLLALYARWLCSAMLQPKGHAQWRPKVWLLFSVVFFGQLLFGVLGVDRMLMTGTLHLPVPALIVAGPVFRGEGMFMLMLFGSTVLLAGPAWCSHLCYIGAWDDVMSRRGGRPRTPSSIRRLSVLGRGATLILCVAAAAVLRMTGVPAGVAVVLAAVFGLIGVGVMVFLSRRFATMVHCTTFCPMGLLANVFGKLSPWRIRLGEECTGCGACAKVCRYGALDAERIELRTPALSCTLCGDCTAVCAHGQARYTFFGHSSIWAEQVFIVTVVSLHAVFLGVARI